MEMREDFLENKNNYNEELEKEMDDLDLEDWEKEEVRNNYYDPTSFEEYELEEDDYHFEDD